MPQSTQPDVSYVTKQYVHYLQQQMMRTANSSDRSSSQKPIASTFTQATMVQAPIQHHLICLEVLCSRRIGERG